MAKKWGWSLFADRIEIYDQHTMSKAKDIKIDTDDLSMATQPKKIQVNVSDLNSGGYLLHIGSGGHKEIIRLLIK